MILRYSVCGPAESVVVERYHAEEVSHFDGRVRRSMDLRQSPSQRWGPTAGVQHNADQARWL